MSDQTEIVYLPTDEIQENAWNPNVTPDETMRALVENIRRAGFNQPLLVRPNVGDGRPYEVVDGEHRLRAARVAGVEFVPCVVRAMDDADAKAQTIAMNRLRGEMDPSQVAALVREIDAAGIDLDSLADFSGFTREELDALDQLLTMDLRDAAPAGPRTTPQDDDERWIDVRVRVPYSIATMFRSELDRLKDVRATEHDHLALELMILNSSHVPPEQM